MRSIPLKLIVPSLLCATALLLLPLQGAHAGADGESAAEAARHLEALETALKDRGGDEPATVTAIQAVATDYAAADEATRNTAETLLVKALVRWRTDRGTKSPNLHELSCIAAAEAIGRIGPAMEAKGRKSFTRKVQAAIDRDLLGRQDSDDISQAQLDASFAALGHLNDPATLDWYLDDFMHTKTVELRPLIAAHRSMLLFRAVPGRLRHAFVKEFVSRYVSVEAQAALGRTTPEIAAKRFWDEVRLFTIPAARHFAGEPTGENGVALATMAELNTWWRDHKKPSDPVWRDE